MYFFSGSNLFGQWYGCNDSIIAKFRTFPEDQKIDHDFDVNNSTLVYIGWSHNIFQFNNKFYIVGDYKKSGQYLEIISIPEECSNSKDLAIFSDDYHIVLINKETCQAWSICLEKKNVKTYKLCSEVTLESEAKKIKSDDTISKCSAFNGTLMFLTSNGLVYSGILPSLVDTRHCVGKPVDIKCGYEHFMLLTDAGGVYTWGNGRRLQLGHGDVSIIDIPTEVEALAGIKISKIAAGGWHSLALSEFGDLYAWGWNDTGQLGVKKILNTLESYSLPTLVDLFADNGSAVNVNIKDIACGSRHSAIILEDNSIWTSGNNKYGQLGLSLDNNLTMNHFRKSGFCKYASSLMCGQWSTVIVSKSDQT